MNFWKWTCLIDLMIPCCRASPAIRFHILYVDFWLPYHIETWVWFLRLCSWVFLKLFNWNLGVSYSVNLGSFWCYGCVHLDEGSRGMWSKSVWELGWELDGVLKLRRRRSFDWNFLPFRCMFVDFNYIYRFLVVCVCNLDSWVEFGGRERVFRRVRRWPAAYCCLVTEVMKMVKFLHWGFVSDKLAPITFEKLHFKPWTKLSKVYKINLLI